MSEDESVTGSEPIPRPAGGEPYLAHKYGLTIEQVRELVEKVGPTRAKLEAAAKKLKMEADAANTASTLSADK